MIRTPTALVYATPMEAAPLLAALAHVSAPDARESIFVAGDLLIALCGMGLAPARAMAARLAERWSVRRIVNLGVAGSLTRALAVGDIVQVSRVLGAGACDDGVATTALALPALGLRSGARLISRDEPVFDANLRARLSTYADVVDMEGFAIAHECVQRGVDCLMFKSVSDDATDRDTLLANLDRASRRLAGFVLGHLSQLKHGGPCP